MKRASVLLLFLIFATNAFSVSREGHTRNDTVLQLIKKVVRSLGDGLTIPKP